MGNKLIRLLQYLKRARSDTGKSFARQIQEIVTLRRHGFHLGVMDYFELGVFDDRYFPSSDKKRCVGWNGSNQLDRILNDDYWRALSNDKIVMYAMLHHFGCVAPRILATFSPQGRRVADEIQLGDRSELETYLTTAARFPIFIKPIRGAYGRGTFALLGYDSDTRRFTDLNDRQLPLTEVLDGCADPRHCGVLVQELLTTHSDLLPVVGRSTSCVRVIVILTANGPKIRQVFWKIARWHNITDNFHMGSTGNLLAQVDSSDGRVLRAVNGFWPGGEEIAVHPDSSADLVGLQLPDWPEMRTRCLAAAAHFPGLRLQGWDVAFCEGGPVLVELNTEADLEVPQFLDRSPFVNDEIEAMLAQAHTLRMSPIRLSNPKSPT